MNMTILIAGVAAVAVVGIILIYLIFASRKKASDSSSEEKFMRELPPAETMAATKEDNEGITFFDHDEGEKLAAPFAEQIEDIFRAKVKADPTLQKYEIDFGTDANKALEIWVDGKAYASVDELPDERLREAFRSAVEKWNAK
jgi:hypothetical protein